MTSPKTSKPADADGSTPAETWQTETLLAALDILSTPITIADDMMVIRHVNPAATKMFTAIDVIAHQCFRQSNDFTEIRQYRS